MSVHDQNASVASLARVMLGEIDERQEYSRVRSASLKLVLETMIRLAEPGHHMKIVDTSIRSVADHLKSVEDIKATLDG